MSVQRGRKSSPIDFTTLTDYQDEFLRADKRYLGFVSGVGAGKTYAGIVRTFLNMEVWNPGEMGAIVAPTRQMVVNVIIPEMRDVGLLDNWEYNSSYSDEPGLHAPNGSRALILSADNKKTVERLRGLNLAWGWVDERTAVPNRAKEILMQRLRIGNYRNLYETTTPKGKDDTYDFYVGDVTPAKEQFGEATKYETEDRLAIVGVPTRANPELPEDYQEAMATDMPEQIRAQEVEGKFVEIGTGVFEREMFSFIHPTEINDDYTFKTIIAVDPAATVDEQRAEENDSDYWAVTSVAIHQRTNTALVTDTARRRGMSLSEGVEWIGKIANQSRDATVVVESNQAQVFLQNALKDAGVYAKPVKNTRNKEDRIVDMSIPLTNMVEFVDWNAETPEDVGNNHPYQDLVSELLAWPEGGHDDMADSLALALEYCPLSWGTSILSANPYEDKDE